ncbi:MAG: hypothetical protein K2I25_02580 [Muribaculaceae bacterium]|nr:hypothetical protein [Muribaculaceae bacterium]
MKDGVLTFETENPVLRHKQEFRKDMPVGLDNCRNRLAALFPGRHKLVTSEENSTFKVKLILNLNRHGENR